MAERKTGWLERVVLRSLDTVEKQGNRLPQPVTLFLILIVIVLSASWIAASLGVSAVHPGTGQTITAVNLLNGQGITRILTEMVRTFTAFPPLGLVLVVMLGIGVAERSGLIAAALKAFVSSVPRGLVTASIVTAGQLSSLAVDAGYVVLIPIGAVIFLGMGRHPIAGLAAAFAGVSGGFGANLFLTSLDPLLAGFTDSAAKLMNPAYNVAPTSNWYFMAASVPVVTAAGTYVTERILEPRLGKYEGGASTDNQKLTQTEKKGLLWATITAVILTGLAFLTIIPEDGILRDDKGGFTPFFTSIVPIMLFMFLLPGLVYGVIVRSIRSDKQVASMTTEAMSTMGGYIVLAFAAAQFVAYFGWSNLGVIFAITGADLLKSIGFTGIPLIVAFVLVASFINIFIGSASAKWAIMAPIFVPMLMLMGYSPELTQASYRIGDSYSNILTPLLPYFPLVVTFAQKYVKDIGIGSIISAMLPFAVTFALARILMLIIWMLAGIPVGPDAPLQYAP